jgi:hypothetical protein
MSNLLSDLGSLSGSEFLQNLGQTGLGQKYSDKITTSVQKKLNPTPKPAPQQPAEVYTSTAVDVAGPSKDWIKKVAIAVAGVTGLLVVVYLVKKGKK